MKKNKKFQLKLAFLFCILLVCSSYTAHSQKRDTTVNFESYLGGELVVSTFIQAPTLSAVGAIEVFIDETDFSWPTRISVYKVLDNNLRLNNYILIQMGLIYKINKKVSLGSYWFNMNLDYPPKRYLANISYTDPDFNYPGYTSPLSLFARIDVNSIVKTGFLSNTQIFFEGNYYNRYKLGAFKITYTQKILYTHKKK